MSLEKEITWAMGLIDKLSDEDFGHLNNHIRRSKEIAVEEYKERVKKAINKIYTINCPEGGSMLLVKAGVELKKELGL